MHMLYARYFFHHPPTPPSSKKLPPAEASIRLSTAPTCLMIRLPALENMLDMYRSKSPSWSQSTAATARPSSKNAALRH